MFVSDDSANATLEHSCDLFETSKRTDVPLGIGIRRSNAYLIKYETFKTRHLFGWDDYTWAMYGGLIDIIYHVYFAGVGLFLGGVYGLFPYLAAAMFIVDLCKLPLVFIQKTFKIRFNALYLITLGLEVAYDIVPTIYVAATLPPAYEDYDWYDHLVFLTMLISFGMIYLDYYQYMGLRNLE
jgi:hypothetical protein